MRLLCSKINIFSWNRSHHDNWAYLNYWKGSLKLNKFISYHLKLIEHITFSQECPSCMYYVLRLKPVRILLETWNSVWNWNSLITFQQSIYQCSVSKKRNNQNIGEQVLFKIFWFFLQL